MCTTYKPDATYPVLIMDNQIEHHLPLITSRLVFAPRIFLSPPTITNRMEFPSIFIETRDDSPVPEQRHARTPAKASTSKTEHHARTPAKRASTPKTEHHARTTRAEQNRSRTPAKRSSTPRASTIARPVQGINTAVAFANDMDLGNLSPLTGAEDETEDETEDEDEDMLDAIEAEHGDEGVEERLIPKPKGEAGRPCAGGYNLIKTLDWNQRVYDSVQVSKCRVYMKESTHQSLGIRRKGC